MRRRCPWLQVALDAQHPGQIDEYDEDFWQAFEDAEEWAENRPTPWYRRVGSFVAALIVVGMLATGALLPWGELFDRLDNVEEPFEILDLAEQTVDESPYGWLVEDVRVRDIIPSGVAGFVHSAPADGIITIDAAGIIQSVNPAVEAIFGYEDKLVARRRWGAGEHGRARPKYGGWRDAIIQRVDDRLRYRKREADRKYLAAVEREALVARGVSELTAMRQAQRNAEDIVTRAAETRSTQPGYQGALYEPSVTNLPVLLLGSRARVVVGDPRDALDLLLLPNRLVATLRE